MVIGEMCFSWMVPDILFASYFYQIDEEPSSAMHSTTQKHL